MPEGSSRPLAKTAEHSSEGKHVELSCSLSETFLINIHLKNEYKDVLVSVIVLPLTPPQVSLKLIV